MSGSIDVKFLNDVPDDELRNRMKHYYIRSRRSERDTDNVRKQLRLATEENQALLRRLSRFYDLAEEIQKLES